MSDQGKLLGGALMGAGLMYLLDPERGARRRGLVRDQVVRAGHKLGDGLDATSRDVRNRAVGAAAEVKSRFDRNPVSDEVLYERVRSAIGRAASHPRAISITLSEGQVTLDGDVLEDELDTVISTVRRVRGVSEVVNQLTAHRDASGVPALQGGRAREPRGELRQENWAPATRLLVGSVGGLLGWYGIRSRNPLGAVAGAAAAGILTRAVANRPVTRLTGIRGGRRVIDVQKAINVAAPIDKVWALWSNYENFPRFMAHLHEVRRTGEQRSHWIAVGPGGSSVEWDAVTTAWVPNERIAWKSVEGSTVENSGSVSFRRVSDDVTRIEVRMTYHPPGGAMGHAIATLFGDDPKSAMDADLVRLKSLLEDGKTSADEGQVRLEELPH
jgi:uncharacterized membrane protein